MLKKIGTLFAAALFTSISAQEFTTFKNGLIYNENTMTKLEKIVDSLHLKYKTCDLNKIFYSKPQTKGHIIRLDSNHVLQAKKDMDNNISFEDFMAKYPNAKIEKDALILKTRAKNYQDKEIIRYEEMSLIDDEDLYIENDYKKNLYEKPAKNTWAYVYRDKTSYSQESIEAFYFPENFKSIPLDQKYSKQIVYSDCLIDTSSTKFKENAKNERFSSFVSLPKNWQKLSKKEKEKLLDNMRSEQAVGSCSNDQSPRIQGINMALLSADVANWEVFLKSHLDIMNDRFERVSDGSYAWKDRQTYIKELEELDINVHDLLFGTIFRVENPEKNHYYGNIGRLGRAISESKDKNLFLAQMLTMVEDEKLDDYNRILAYFLYTNCNGYTKSKTEKKFNNAKIINSVKKLPKYLADQIKIETV
ncbi:hypothetical protein [Chryseobacterium sp. JUb7]|uniref:hypothetical protein n=1 Tax=Chryseobacterium sp. JUb7 TaxID=2940599 RepID=UPI002168E3D7|nr:hypothetical protein [Chryseobacterium sp. JUb7]MCS3531750.1 hypothetical protein [Chryseobacterium sp. JUb7]